MKKIIAAAVASAFVAPAFAADVTLSGYAEFSHQDVNGENSATSTTSIVDDTNIVVRASDELGNGMSITATLNVNQDGGTESQAVSLSGEFGSLTVGDTAGAIDAVDGAADPFIAAGRIDSDDVAFGGDAGVRWVLPAFAPGLTVALTNTPENGSAGAVSDTNGFSVSYSTGTITASYASEEVAGLGKDFGGLSATFQGLTLAVESVNEEQAAGNADIDFQAIGAQYTMGDITFAVTSAEADQGGTMLSERTTVGVHYAMGPATFFAEQTSDDVDDEDQTAIGVAYSF